MIYLLDVNMLIAAILQDHEDQPMVEAWLRGKQTATCPISELCFLRISSGYTFRFVPNHSLAERLCPKLSGNIVADLFRT